MILIRLGVINSKLLLSKKPRKCYRVMILIISKYNIKSRLVNNLNKLIKFVMLQYYKLERHVGMSLFMQIDRLWQSPGHLLPLEVRNHFSLTTNPTIQIYTNIRCKASQICSLFLYCWVAFLSLYTHYIKI